MLTTLRQRNFALLWLGGLISQTGDWLLQIGLPVYIYLLTGSALDTSLMLIVAFLPNILLGSVAGVLVDRWDRRWTMLIANLLLAVGLLPMLLVHDKGSLWILYVALFFESAVDQVVQPAQSALIPHQVSEEQLVTANSLNLAGSSASRLAGAALGGILLATLGLHSTILLDLISFLFVSAMLWLIKLPVSGGLLLAQFGKRLAPVRLVGFGFALFGLIDLLIIDLPLFLHNVWLVGLLFILVGIPGTASRVGFQTLFQNIVEDRLRGRIFGALLSASALMMLLGMVLAGVLGDRLGPVILLNIQGSGYLLSGVMALLVLGRLLATQTAPRQEDVRAAFSVENKAG